MVVGVTSGIPGTDSPPYTMQYVYTAERSFFNVTSQAPDVAPLSSVYKQCICLRTK